MDGEEVIAQAKARLEGSGSHVPFETAIDNIPFGSLGERVDRVPFTLWQLIEHLRLAQRDILEYVKDPTHDSPPWPDGYWPASDAPSSEIEWRASVERFLSDRDELIRFLSNDPTRVLAGTDHSVLREALIASTHLSYHVGQIVLLRRLLGCWD